MRYLEVKIFDDGEEASEYLATIPEKNVNKIEMNLKGRVMVVTKRDSRREAALARAEERRIKTEKKRAEHKKKHEARVQAVAKKRAEQRGKASKRRAERLGR